MIQDGDWKEDEDEAWTTNNSDTLSYAIVASKAWIARSVVPEGGTMLATLNGKAVSTYSEIAKSCWTHLIFVVLKQAVYTINLEKAAESIKEGKKLKITGMYVLNNDEKGLIEFNETNRCQARKTSHCQTIKGWKIEKKVNSRSDH